MNIQDLTTRLSESAAKAPALEKSVKFDFGDAGKIYVDGYNNNAVSNDDNDADCEIKVSLEDFIDLVKGDLNPMNAFMGGKLVVNGDMSVAMKLQSLLS